LLIIRIYYIKYDAYLRDGRLCGPFEVWREAVLAGTTVTDVAERERLHIET
jgi:hypothetical protein